MTGPARPTPTPATSSHASGIPGSPQAPLLASSVAAGAVSAAGPGRIARIPVRRQREACGDGGLEVNGSHPAGSAPGVPAVFAMASTAFFGDTLRFVAGTA